MKKSCELYKYDRCFYAVKQEDIPYFANEFLEAELDEDHVCWLNIHDLSNTEAIKQFCQKLHIEKLSIENIYQRFRRPKVEEYKDYMFFSVLFADPALDKNEMFQKIQVTFFLGKDYLVTLQNGFKGYFDEVRSRIELSKGKIRSQKSDFLLYRCLEAIIDNYYSIVDDIIQISSELEIRLHEEVDKSLLHDIEHQKRKLIQLRTISSPMRDITEQINASDSNLLSKENKRYFRNILNHGNNLISEIESQIQVLDGLTNFYYAAQGQRMNEIMKVLTIVSAIFIPLTFIVGVYGMNFEYMPELKWKFGYFSVLLVMFFLGIGLFTYFIRRGWLKKGDYLIKDKKKNEP